MPFINVMTNSEIKDKDALKAELGNDITAIPGKSEAWLMVKFEDKADMYFKGSNEPCAMFEIAVFGSASKDAYENLTKRICKTSRIKLLNYFTNCFASFSDIHLVK